MWTSIWTLASDPINSRRWVYTAHSVSYGGHNKVQAGWLQFSSVQSLNHVQLFATPWIAALQVSLSITNSRSLLKLMPIESVMPSSHLILCHPLFLLPPIPPSIRVFSSESTLRMRWPKYWSFSFSISPSNEHPGLISFRMDWLNLLAVQGTLKSLLQHHSSKASIFRRSAFFIVQLSHPYMTTGKTIALEQYKCVVSQLWRPEVQNEGICRASLPWKMLGSYLFQFCLLHSGGLRHPLACRWPSSPCVSLHLIFRLCDLCPSFCFLWGHQSYWLKLTLMISF